MTKPLYEANLTIEDEPAPLGTVFRAVMEIEIAGGTTQLVAAAVEKLGDELVGRVLDKNNGDAIVVISYVSRDVDFSPTYVADEPDLT